MTRWPTIEAIRFEGDNVTAVAEFLGIDWPDETEPVDHVILELPGGDEQLAVGDYLARDLDGGWQPCPGPLFEWLFEAM